MFRSEEDFQRAQNEYRRLQRSAEQSARERIWYFDMMLSSLYVFVLTVGLLLSMNEQNCYNYKTWIKVMCGFYILDLIVSMNQLMHVKKKYHENLWLLLCSLLMLLVTTGWYVYGNVIYYQNRSYCSDIAQGDAEAQTQTLWIMILFGYMTFIKCCCLSVCVIYLIPILIQIYRNQRNHGWEAAAPNLLSNLRRGKFNP